VSVALAGGSVLPACSSAASLAPSGGSCLQSTDCAEGLVCIQKNNAGGYCSADVGLIQFTEEAGAPVDATVPGDASAPPPSDGAAASTDAPDRLADAMPVADASPSTAADAAPDAAPSSPDASTEVDATAPVDAAPPDATATD
jgi:hypothetical protein